VPISAELNFTRDGLVLGAGTIIVPAQGPRLLKSLDGEEARVLALLSAAYGKAVPPSVLGNIRRAAKTWCEGDDCLAYIHLVHAGLQPLHDSEESAYRLFLADSAMKAGASPQRYVGRFASIRFPSTRSNGSTTKTSRVCPRAAEGQAVNGRATAEFLHLRC
jgi:hypothetical protein